MGRIGDALLLILLDLLSQENHLLVDRTTEQEDAWLDVQVFSISFEVVAHHLSRLAEHDRQATTLGEASVEVREESFFFLDQVLTEDDFLFDCVDACLEGGDADACGERECNWGLLSGKEDEEGCDGQNDEGAESEQTFPQEPRHAYHP